MNFSKFISILISILLASSNLMGYKHKFTNKTNETVDIEVPLVPFLTPQNRVVERIVPGETREFETHGESCIEGVNIWRFQKPRNPANLIGTWHFNKDLSTWSWSVKDEYSGDGKHCGNNHWTLSGSSSGNSRIEGFYQIKHSESPGIFYQGSDAAWTKKFRSKLADF